MDIARLKANLSRLAGEEIVWEDCADTTNYLRGWRLVVIWSCVAGFSLCVQSKPTLGFICNSYFPSNSCAFVSSCQVTANDLQENITKLNNGVTFMIKHSQKLFKVTVHWSLALPALSVGVRMPFTHTDPSGRGIF